MSSHLKTMVFQWLLFVCLLCSGADVEAQTGVQTPAAPSKSIEASGGSEEKLVTYQLKHAKAAEVLKIWQKLLGGYVRSITVDERTNSIVLIANEATADEALATLALLDGELPSSNGISPSPEVHSQPPLRKVTFKHARAADVLKIMQNLVGDALDDGKGFVVDERTNSLLYLSHDVSSPEFEEFCRSLDTPTPSQAESSTGKSIDQPALEPHPQVFTFSIGFERGESLEAIKQRYNELEQHAHQRADKLKQIRSRPPYESELGELKTAVRKSFEARQALQRAELDDLAQRMKSMQQSIDMRDKLADKVVQRRVEDLLDPNLKWEAEQVSEQLLTGPNQGSSNPTLPLPPSPLPLDVSVPYVPGEPPATVFRKRIQGRWIVQTHSDGNKDALPELAGQVEVEIEGNSMRYLVGKQEMTGPIFLADCKELESLRLREDGPLPIDFVYDPNGDPQTFRGIIACDGTTLSICMASDDGRANKDFRPSLFVPGTKVTLIKCRRAEPETANASSVGQATYSIANLQMNGPLKEPESNSLRQFATPQELLAAVKQYGKSGSYEDFVTLFNEEGVRDLAGSLLMSALQLTGSVDLAKNQGAEASSGTDSGVAAVSEVLKRWLPQSANAEQLKAMSDSLSTMLSAIGGASPDQSALQAYVISMRKSVEGIGDHRKFGVEMMQAYEKLTTKPFVYFGNADQQSEWQVSQVGARAIATLVDGSPLPTRITLQQAYGTWRISSMFNELVKVTKEDETGGTPSTPAMETQQRLQGQWDVKIISFSAGDPKELVIRDDLLLLPGNLLGKPILISMKLEWPNPNQLDEVDIIWEPNDQQAGYVINRLVGRIRCDGEKLQLCFVDGSGKVTRRPREMCGGDGIFYLECMRKRVSDSSKPLKDENAGANLLLGPTYSGRPIARSNSPND